MVEHYYHEIQGWFDFQAEYKWAVENAADGAVLVEVGCWRGASLSFLLVEAANSGKKLQIVGVDNFRGFGGESTEVAARSDIGAECRRNCDRAGYPYQLIAAPSSEVASHFPDESVDFVFLDADHNYDSVRDDIRAWMPNVKWGGILAGHDYRGVWPGVFHAVNDFIPQVELLFLDNLEPRADASWTYGTSWGWRKEVRSAGRWLREPDEGTAYAGWLLYMGYVNSPDYLHSALRSIDPYAKRVVVIDQSDDGSATGIHRGPLFRWTAGMHFSAVQNWIQRDALRRGLKYFLVMHSDAEAAPDGIDLILTEADRRFNDSQRCGAIFTHFDALCAFNPLAVADVGCWDETFQWYVSDVDYYNRLKWGGWGWHGAPEALRVHHYSQTLRGLDAARRDAVLANQEWALRHYRHKWGCSPEESDGRRWGCPYDGKYP